MSVGVIRLDDVRLYYRRRSAQCPLVCSDVLKVLLIPFRSRTTVASLARFAARIFSLRPPIGKTRPRHFSGHRESRRTGICASAEAVAVAMVMPQGPSLGVAPAADGPDVVLGKDVGIRMFRDRT